MIEFLSYDSSWPKNFYANDRVTTFCNFCKLKICETDQYMRVNEKVKHDFPENLKIKKSYFQKDSSFFFRDVWTSLAQLFFIFWWKKNFVFWLFPVKIQIRPDLTLEFSIGNTSEISTCGLLKSRKKVKS